MYLIRSASDKGGVHWGAATAALKSIQGYEGALEVALSGFFLNTETAALAASTETYATNAATGAMTAQPASCTMHVKEVNHVVECSLTAIAMISGRVFKKSTKLSVL